MYFLQIKIEFSGYYSCLANRSTRLRDALVPGVGRRALHRAALDGMATNSHCAESVLHGLGHWHGAFSKVVEGLIDAFLATHSDARPELLANAPQRPMRLCAVAQSPRIRFHAASRCATIAHRRGRP